MSRADGVWLAVAAAALVVGVGGAYAMRRPSLGVRAQLQIDLAVQHLARWAGDRDGVFPLAAELTDASAHTLPARDPWGHAWRYERVAARGPVHLWSVGANGVDEQGTGDDIASWTR